MTDETEIIRRPFYRRRVPLQRLLQAVEEHPVVSVVVVAFLVRLLVVVLSFFLTHGYLMPDEKQYVDLGRAVASGQSLEKLNPGDPKYGQFLYHQTWSFSGPLSLFFWIFGSTRLVGQLFVAAVGAAVAGVTVSVGSRFLRPGSAVCAGLLVALTPSQVLFSSVVLRESLVWLALALVALGALHLSGTDWHRLVRGVAVAVVGLLALAFLRPQTLLAACWALALALVFTPRQRWLPRVAAGVALAAILPWIGGTGIGGLQLADRTAPSLGAIRARLAVGAHSAFGSGAQPLPAAPKRQPPPAAPTGAGAGNGAEGVSAGLGHLPRGVVNVILRPYPWESTVGTALLLARVENLGWYLLYGLTAVGIVVSVRRRPARLALQFPVLVMGMLVGIAALTEGNLGTAFRHREQVLWVLSLCAVAGLEWLMPRASPHPRAPSRGLSVQRADSELQLPSNREHV